MGRRCLSIHHEAVYHHHHHELFFTFSFLQRQRFRVGIPAGVCLERTNLTTPHSTPNDEGLRRRYLHDVLALLWNVSLFFYFVKKKKSS
jgi:hypothetical protein